MAFINPLSKATCPFCFHSFHLSKAPKRLTDPNQPVMRDPKLGNFLGTPGPELGAIKEPSDFSIMEKIFGRVFVTDDWKSGHKKICPNCHMYLPHATASGQLNSKTIAIIGARSSGKSNYFGVLLHELENRYADEVGFTIYDQETYSLQHNKQISSKKLYKTRYGSRLYGNEEYFAINQNKSAQQETDLRIPLIYRLEFPNPNNKKLFSFSKPVISMDLVIFDAAGEDLQDPEAIEKLCNYLLNSSGIIFLIDPLQFDLVRKKLEGTLTNSEKNKIDFDSSEMISRIINLFQSRGGLKLGGKIPVPTAFAFSKFDLIEKLISPQSLLHKNNKHKRGFNLKNCRKISEEVLEFTINWENKKFANLVERKFETYCFFAFSALGQSPNPDSLQIERVRPKNVADPLLWLLWKNGYISTMK